MKKRQKLFGQDYFGPIAHRGLHNEIYTENGLKAFDNAIRNGFSFELDIHLTKDGHLIVCHDDDLKRTTGKEGIIEDLTLEEIKSGYKLFDGGEIPTLQEVLDLNQERKLIVVELKVHDSKNYKELGKEALRFLKEKIKDKKKIVVISFDPRALIHFRHSGFATALLVCKKYEWMFKWRFLFDSVDVEDVLLREPKVMKYQKKHIVNVWTIEKAESLRENLEYSDAQTFQLIDPETVKEIYGK
ncbi:MAG: hypothetical protein MJ190_00155 [Bacilli bacterium]|nr:hypothetical protein [Bacilli bacterium]